MQTVTGAQEEMPEPGACLLLPACQPSSGPPAARADGRAECSEPGAAPCQDTAQVQVGGCRCCSSLLISHLCVCSDKLTAATSAVPEPEENSQKSIQVVMSVCAN